VLLASFSKSGNMDIFCKSDAKALFFLGICKGLREKYVLHTSANRYSSSLKKKSFKFFCIFAQAKKEDEQPI
jgi:hypothetical protein